jgi:recombination protein RecR
MVDVRRSSDARPLGDVDEEGRTAEVEARMRIRARVRRPAQQTLVEGRQGRDIVREERYLGNPGHVGTIGQVLSPAVENLVAQLSRLPGVGSRTAHRLAFHLLQRPTDEALALSAAIQEVKERVRFCDECGNLTEEQRCAICRDTRRDHTLICVVEQPVDLISLEKTSEFRGLYHVLGGALSPLDGVEPEHLRIDELLGRVERNGVQEVVLATNPNMTGEATAAYLADRLRGRVRVTRLASGLPVGGDLEYADEVTLGRALTGRREME